MSVGILMFGLIGVGLGSLTGSDSATVAFYIGGFLLGAFLGAWVGRRIEANNVLPDRPTDTPVSDP